MRMEAEGARHITQPLAIFHGALEAPRKLEQHGPQFSGFHQDIEPGANLFDLCSIPRFSALVREPFPELRGKAEIFVGTHPLHPLAGSLRNGRPVKAGMYLNRIEKIRDVGELVELGRLRFWINDPLPVLVHPSSRSES